MGLFDDDQQPPFAPAPPNLTYGQMLALRYGDQRTAHEMARMRDAGEFYRNAANQAQPDQSSSWNPMTRLKNKIGSALQLAAPMPHRR